MTPVAQTRLWQQLRAIGVEPGSTLIVHTAFSRVRPIEGGPKGLIAALRQALGPSGTLVMPSMADSDDEPFDSRSTPARDMGIVADTFWQLPGVSRSDSPHAFAAVGPQAAKLTQPHPPDVPHGEDSPVGRAWKLDAQVLLLGVGQHANTTLHLAEELAQVRYRIPAVANIFCEGKPTLVSYREIDHCCEGFAQMDGWLEERGLLRRGIVGHGEARLARSRDLVRVALEQLHANETVFLHAPGKCAECDSARAGSVTAGLTPR